MNIHVYKHFEETRSALCDRQSKVYRELRRLEFEVSRLFCPSREMVHRLEALREENESLNSQIADIRRRMLRFELSGNINN